MNAIDEFKDGVKSFYDSIKNIFNTLINKEYNAEHKDILKYPMHQMWCSKCQKFRWKHIYNIEKKHPDNTTNLDLQIHECSYCHNKRKLVYIDPEKRITIPLALYIAEKKGMILIESME